MGISISMIMYLCESYLIPEAMQHDRVEAADKQQWEQIGRDEEGNLRVRKRSVSYQLYIFSFVL